MPPEAINPDPANYRPGVGIVLFNSQGLVLIAERIDNPGAWQMPQGGIDNDPPEIAVFREMEEEIGTRNAEILGMMEEWLYYDFPPKLSEKLWDGNYKGQRQKWIALRFLGDDSEINPGAYHTPEFRDWKWVPLAEVTRHAVPFKRKTYELVIREFAQYARP